MDTIIQMMQVAKLNRSFLKGKTLQLVEAVEDGTIRTREEVVAVLFKNSNDPEQAVKKFLRKVRRQLNLSILASLRPNSYHQEVYFEVYTGFASVNVMLAAAHRKPAIQEARRIYNIACSYEIFDVAAPLANRLARYYADSEPNARLNKRFAEEALQHTEVNRIYTLSNSLYSDAIIRINNRTSYSPSVKAKIDHYLAEVENDRFASIEVCTQYHIMQAIECFARQDYARAILCCRDVLDFFSQKVPVRTSHKAIFLSMSSVAAIAAKKYDIAEQRLKEAIELNGFSNANWQVYNYYLAINALHQGNYFKARHLHDEAARREQSDYIKELWAIIGAYCAFLTESPLKLGKFFNETVLASQDKAGTNINIIIADLLLSLQNNRDRFIHRTEAVQTYVYRYLKGDQYERVRLFLRLLFLVAKKDFDPRRIRKAGAYILTRLKKRSVYANHNMEIELIPWEQAWEVVMERLGEKRQKRVG